jgi:hypothetical protein
MLDGLIAGRARSVINGGVDLAKGNVLDFCRHDCGVGCVVRHERERMDQMTVSGGLVDEEEKKGGRRRRRR